VADFLIAQTIQFSVGSFYSLSCPNVAIGHPCIQILDSRFRHAGKTNGTTRQVNLAF